MPSAVFAVSWKVFDFVQGGRWTSAALEFKLSSLAIHALVTSHIPNSLGLATTFTDEELFTRSIVLWGINKRVCLGFGYRLGGNLEGRISLGLGGRLEESFGGRPGDRLGETHSGKQGI